MVGEFGTRVNANDCDNWAVSAKACPIRQDVFN